ncbi:MAG: ABC transporter ATP-binding protein [Alphaproteobacteria bacterium]|uniref:ABC transporter ATP-binding protein n=1 Tax=Candidatus Nitrobium versatile TaxID=2884831 RepID=A0A953J347_9BACT|nr:ABC transporter ATP-binding protein [Candidatus Nitrobium versatile]
MSIITAKNLVKEYGPLRAVDGIDFAIGRGEFFGFLGPNGAGKTTVMRMLHCFMPPTSGELRVFDLDVTKHPSEIKARIGVMPQENNLDPDLTVCENLIVYARYFDIQRKVAVHRAAELLGFVDLREKEKAKIDTLSGGMKHRLLLARALINTPELLILDEPTTGLDPHSRIDVWEKLNHLKSQKITLILTTHYMEEAERLCDRVAIMDSGKIVTVDSPESLMRVHGCKNLEDVYLQLTGRSLAD